MVIAYHEIVPDECSYVYGTTESAFENHVQTITAITNRGEFEERPLITFDDGHISHFEKAVPILEKYRLKAAFFVTAGWTDTQPEYMRKQHLRELVLLGHSVYAHGWSHKMLTHCTPSELWEELHHSRRALQDKVGTSIDSISIPHGRWNKRVLEACAAAGYRDVYTSDSHKRVLHTTNGRLIGRLMMTRRLSPPALANFLRGETDGRISRAKSVMKTLLRSVLGDLAYRKLWLFVGSKHSALPCIGPVPRPVRVLQLISSGGFYGAERMVLNLSKALDGNNYQAVVCAFRNGRNPHTEIADRAREDRLETEIVPCSGPFDVNTLRRLRTLLYQQGVEVVHTHGFKAQFYGALAVWGLKIPLFATYHSEQPRRSTRLRFYHHLNRCLLFRFDKAVSVSECIETSLRESGLAPNKLMTIRNGIEIEAFESGAQRDAKEPTGYSTIGLIGRLIPLKGHSYLLNAATEVLRSFPQTRFVFVGAGPELSKLHDLVHSLGLQEFVTFKGFQTDMAAAYRDIDIVVLPSITEGMPMTILEAMAARRPVIATGVGEIPKLIVDGHTGLLIEPANVTALQNAILRLLSDPEEAARFAENGHALVIQKHSAQEMARSYANLYAQFLT